MNGGQRSLPPRVVLASQSPRRRDLLSLIGIAHVVRPADVDETMRAGESPDALAERLARAKALAVRATEPDAIVIGSDTIVVLDGEVHYNPGKFLNAAAENASLDNEQMSIGVQMEHHRVLFRQIAGLIARRIVTYSRVGDDAEQGERMGIIRFGSRVDVFVPVGSTIRAKVGDRPVAGVTVLAELPE